MSPRRVLTALPWSGVGSRDRHGVVHALDVSPACRGVVRASPGLGSGMNCHRSLSFCHSLASPCVMGMLCFTPAPACVATRLSRRWRDNLGGTGPKRWKSCEGLTQLNGWSPRLCWRGHVAWHSRRCRSERAGLSTCRWCEEEFSGGRMRSLSGMRRVCSGGVLARWPYEPGCPLTGCSTGRPGKRGSAAGRDHLGRWSARSRDVRRDPGLGRPSVRRMPRSSLVRSGNSCCRTRSGDHSWRR